MKLNSFRQLQTFYFADTDSASSDPKMPQEQPEIPPVKEPPTNPPLTEPPKEPEPPIKA
jgi:hypothetical protein